ncbi:MAG: hypothetical protein HQK77_03340 [Desulfobacterales bacterium]|nr:hypothetical protein [Desulfobacterales bacterium]
MAVQKNTQRKKYSFKDQIHTYVLMDKNGQPVFGLPYGITCMNGFEIYRAILSKRFDHLLKLSIIFYSDEVLGKKLDLDHLDSDKVRHMFLTSQRFLKGLKNINIHYRLMNGPSIESVNHFIDIVKANPHGLSHEELEQKEIEYMQKRVKNLPPTQMSEDDIRELENTFNSLNEENRAYLLNTLQVQPIKDNSFKMTLEDKGTNEACEILFEEGYALRFNHHVKFKRISEGENGEQIFTTIDGDTITYSKAMLDENPDDFAPFIFLNKKKTKK